MCIESGARIKKIRHMISLRIYSAIFSMEEEVITNNVTIYDHNSGLKPIQSIIKNKRLLNEYWDQEPPYDTL
jgi:hypothetical protein